MAKHGVVERQLLDSEWVGSKRVAIEIDKDMDNGSVVTLNGLVDGEMNLYEVADVTASTPLDDVYLVTTPEVMEDERLKHNLSDFYNIAGKIGNADKMIPGNYVGLTLEVFDASAVSNEPQVGNIVELKAGRKLAVVASLTAGSTQFGTIVDIYNGKYGVRIG